MPVRRRKRGRQRHLLRQVRSGASGAGVGDRFTRLLDACEAFAAEADWAGSRWVSTPAASVPTGTSSTVATRSGRSASRCSSARSSRISTRRRTTSSPIFADAAGPSDLLEPDVVLGQRGRRRLGAGDVRSSESCSFRSNASDPSERWSMCVIHHEKCSAPDPAQARVRVGVEAGRATAVVPVGDRLGQHADVAEGEVESFAPVGGTMCAASPARKRRPCRIGSQT